MDLNVQNTLVEFIHDHRTEYAKASVLCTLATHVHGTLSLADREYKVR